MWYHITIKLEICFFLSWTSFDSSFDFMMLMQGYLQHPGWILMQWHYKLWRTIKKLSVYSGTFGIQIWFVLEVSFYRCCIIFCSYSSYYTYRIKGISDYLIQLILSRGSFNPFKQAHIDPQIQVYHFFFFFTITECGLIRGMI